MESPIGARCDNPGKAIPGAQPWVNRPNIQPHFAPPRACPFVALSEGGIARI
jgi:hypothetical protein